MDAEAQVVLVNQDSGVAVARGHVAVAWGPPIILALPLTALRCPVPLTTLNCPKPPDRSVCACVCVCVCVQAELAEARLEAQRQKSLADMGTSRYQSEQDAGRSMRLQV